MSELMPNWTAMVLLSARRHVRHIAVWSDMNMPPGPICRSRGDFPWYGRMDEWPDAPVCSRCVKEVELLVSAIQSASDG